MAPGSRIVTATWYRADRSLDANAPISFDLHPGSYTGDAMISGGLISDTTSDGGESATELWTNTEGVTPTAYTVTWPDGKQSDFELPEGDDPISLMTLLIDSLLATWDPTSVSDALVAQVAGIYAAFASTADVALGDGLVGYRAPFTGAIARTVHDRWTDDAVSVLDFIPVAQHAAIRANTSTYDCTANLNAASAANPGRLFFPPGSYCLVGTWEIAYPMVIRGEGARIMHNAVSPPLVGAPVNYLRITASNVTISGLTFDGSLAVNGVPRTGPDIIGEDEGYNTPGNPHYHIPYHDPPKAPWHPDRHDPLTDDRGRRSILIDGTLDEDLEPTISNITIESCHFVHCEFIGSNHKHNYPEYYVKPVLPGDPGYDPDNPVPPPLPVHTIAAPGVHHGIYANGVRNLKVVDCDFPSLSGSAAYVLNSFDVWLLRNYCNEVGYYPLHIDDSVQNCWICENTFGPLCHPDKGGMIDVMGYARQFPCRNFHILNNTLRGRGRYGSVLRVNGTENVDIAGNILDVSCGTQQVMKLGAREVEDEDFSGPNQSVTVSRNIWICRGHFDGYIDSGELMEESGLCALDIRDEHSSIEAQNYQITDNLILSDGTHWFAAGIRLGVGGPLNKSAIHHIEIARNLIEFRWTDTTATTGGIVVTGAYPDKPFTEITIHHNRVKQDPDAAIGTQVRGIYLAQNTTRSRIEHNTIENCYHPLRVAAGADNTLNDSEGNTDINTPVGGQQIIGPELLPPDDVTPSLASCRRWRCSSLHTANRSITGFRNGVPGRMYYIQAAVPGTYKTILVDNTGGTPSTLYLNGNWDDTVTTRLTLVCLSSTEFQELSRN